MGLADYNGFTEKERYEYSKIQQKAIEEGILKPEEETKCVICGQDRGIRVYHVENYFPERIVENSIPMCNSCHLKFHKSRLTNQDKFKEYLESVREIPKPPQYRKTNWLPERDKVLDSYNGFSPEEIEASKEIIKKAIEDGKLKPLKETECVVCSQNKGLREYHVEDFSSAEKIIETAEPVCWTCHQYIHRHKHDHPEIYEKYLKEIGDQPREPVYVTNLWKEEDD